MSKIAPSLVVILSLLNLTSGFVPVKTTFTHHPPSILFSTEAESAAAAASYDDDDTPKMNPDRPELPALKGDYDWDEKFGTDPDWITENIPGKVVLSDVELAAQVTALSKLEEQWQREREDKEYEEGKLVGFSAKAEMFNGRFAMFFLVVGLLTEYWTGVTIPGQIEEMLRVGGFIGFEG